MTTWLIMPTGVAVGIDARMRASILAYISALAGTSWMKAEVMMGSSSEIRYSDVYLIQEHVLEMARSQPRRYDARGRQEQARQNRRTILAEAQRLFLEHGYAKTTVAAIAAAAGVSVETVYKAFTNKPGLAKAVFDVAVV